MSGSNQQPFAGLAGSPSGVVVARTLNIMTLNVGSPVGVLAGQSGNATTAPDIVWDWVNQVLWICTGSGGTPATTTWTQIAGPGSFADVTISGNLVVDGSTTLAGATIATLVIGTSFTLNGAMAGTISGAPIFSGAVQFIDSPIFKTGTPDFQNGFQSEGTITQTGNMTVSGSVDVKGEFSGALFNYLSGLTMSNDGVSPNTVLDISAGVCTDSTNSFAIKLGAFTKSISGSWVAGTGANGMGNGLTATASTWYHVFAIINAGAADIYFDTSITAANAPAGTTAFRRIGSIKLDGSVHILKFTQIGDNFWWFAPVFDVSAVTPTSGAQNTVTLASVPPGLPVIANLGLSAGWVSGVATTLSVYPTFATTAYNSQLIVITSASGAGWAQMPTNSAAQILTKLTYGGSTSYSVETRGWLDPRGRS